MRMILAQEEKERAYGLQEKSLRQLYIKTLKLHKDNPDAIKIIQCCEEDLPNKVLEIMKSRTSEGNGSLSIFEMDQTLTFFSDNQKQSLQENELRKVILKSSAVDQKWFCKIILKRMNLLIGKKKILEIYHPKASALFNKFNHLTRVVELIESGQADSAMIEVTEVFKPIRSMLCQKFTTTLNKDFLQKEMYQETKMDGERFQIHMKNNEFNYYSRNSHEFSEGFNILLSPLIKFFSVVHSIILDGEMLVYDKNEKRYHTKGETTIDVKHMKDTISNFRPCFCAFDVLLYNDQNMMNKQYQERRQLLDQLFEDREGVLVKSIATRIHSVDHMVELFNVAIDNEEEGIILKDADSVYKPGDRAGGWYKVKPDYFDGEVVKDFDCVIIGGYYANPYKKNYIRRYMVGALEKTNDGTFNVYAIGELVHGVTVQERMKINESLKPHLVQHSGEKEIPFAFGKIFFGKNKPHVWIPPNASIVLECRASELARTSEQFTDYTFRFPRINSVRRDKIWNESCTLAEFMEMCKTTDDGRVKKIVMRQVNSKDITSPSRKRKAAPSAASVIAEFCKNSEELDELELIDNVLEGKEFCVLTTNIKLPSIKEMKLMVRKHGGTITMYPRKRKTFAIIAGLMTKMVQSYMSHKIYNVIKADWLVNNFRGEETHKEMPKIRPVVDLYFATDALKESLNEFYDEFGDSYTDVYENAEQLKAFLATMKGEKRGNDLKVLDDEIVANGSININFFRNVSAAFFTSREDHFLFESAKSIFQFHAGKVIDLQDAVSADEKFLVFIDGNEDVESIKKQLADNSTFEHQIVDFKWVLDSSDSKRNLEMKKYLKLFV